MGLFLLRQCMEQFALQLRYNRDRPVSKMATLSIGAIATLDAFKKSASTIWSTLCPCQSPSTRRSGALSSYGTLLITSRQEETWRAFGRNHISWNGHRIGIIRRPACCYSNRLIINDCCFGLYISEITQNTVFWNLFHRWGISQKEGVSFISVNDLPPLHPPDEGSTLDHLAFFSVRLPWGLPWYVLHGYFAFRPSSDLSFFLLGFLWGLPCHWSLFSSALFACQPSIVQPILWDTVVSGALMFLFLVPSDP